MNLQVFVLCIDDVALVTFESCSFILRQFFVVIGVLRKVGILKTDNCNLKEFLTYIYIGLLQLIKLKRCSDNIVIIINPVPLGGFGNRCLSSFLGKQPAVLIAVIRPDSPSSTVMIEIHVRVLRKRSSHRWNWRWCFRWRSRSWRSWAAFGAPGSTSWHSASTDKIVLKIK